MKVRQYFSPSNLDDTSTVIVQGGKGCLLYLLYLKDYK